MMCKRVTALLLLLIVAGTWVPRGHAEAHHCAVLYDDPSSDTLRTLREFTLYSSWDCAYMSIWDAENLDGYDAAVLCVEETRHLPDALARALRKIQVFVIGSGGLEQISDRAEWMDGDVVLSCEGESGARSDLMLNVRGLWLLGGEDGRALGGEIHINGETYPLCLEAGNVAHFAYFDPNEQILCAQLANSLQLWQWPYENAPAAYGQYLVLDWVYPFLDPEALMERTDMLEEEGVPYVLALTPVFDHGDYPAMKRFCEYLRYVQSRGAGLILRVPFVSIRQVDLEDLIRNMEISYEAYAAYGVYPLAVEAPVSWLECEKGLEALRGYRTVFLFESDDALADDEAPDQNTAYRDGHQIVAPAWQDSRVYTSAYAQAIYLDAQMDLEEMRTQIERIKTSKRVLKGLLEMENRVYSGDYAVVSANGILQVNGEHADTAYAPFTYDENYEYDRGLGQYFKEQIETSNNWLMVFVVLACSVFLVMIALFRRQIRRELVMGKKTGTSESSEKVKK
jgi:hypothetical protein